MSNLQHGFYSANAGINPDSIMINNANIKRLLLEHAVDIKNVVDEKMVRPGITDLVVHLIACIMPDNEELSPNGYEEKVVEYFNSRTFKCIFKSIEGKPLSSLKRTVDYFSSP